MLERLKGQVLLEDLGGITVDHIVHEDIRTFFWEAAGKHEAFLNYFDADKVLLAAQQDYFPHVRLSWVSLALGGDHFEHISKQLEFS